MTMIAPLGQGLLALALATVMTVPLAQATTMTVPLLALTHPA